MPSPGSEHGVLAKLGLHRPELRAWAMYDWANSAYWTTVIAAVFPNYFNRVAASDLSATVATTRFAWATTIAVAIVALITPVLGALADQAAMKKRMLGIFLAVGVLSTAGLWYVDRGDWVLALLLFVVSNIGAAGSLSFSDSLLPHIASADEVDRVSTSGYAIGYLGGGLLLAVNLVWIAKPAMFAIPDTQTAVKLSFLSVAVWWAVFALPIFVRVPEPPARHEAGDGAAGNVVVGAFIRLGHTFRELRKYRQALLLLVAFAVYNDGINTIIRMASTYGTVLGIPESSLFSAFLVVQFVGVPFAFLFGRLAVHLGTKNSILLSLVVYTGISVFGYFVTSATHFFLMAFAVATVQGGSQALSRSLFATMVPRHKSSEFFAFFGIFEKFAGILGPMLFALAVERMGSVRPAIVSVVVFFVVGGYLLTRVKVEEGQRIAREAERASRGPS
ncbi:MAG: MFS transporter [Acidobacteriota bacterium]